MNRAARVGLALVALGAGAAAGFVTRTSSTGRAASRPAAVERVARALDGSPSASAVELAAALEAAGDAASWPSPWREEIELGRVVASGDRAALTAFASASPPSPARARAWVRLASDAPDAEARRRCLDELVRRHPDSAAARVQRSRAWSPGR